MAVVTTKAPSYIAPERLYSIKGFIAASGISATRMRVARLKFGLVLPTIEVGRRKFVSGADCIAFVKQLAEFEQLEKRSPAAS